MSGMQPIYFSKAGKFLLDKYVDGKPVRSPETSYSRNGVVQSITPNITINGSPITDGNSLWPAADPDTSIEGSVAIQLGFMPPGLYAFIMGDSVRDLTNPVMTAIDEEILVPDSAPFEVTLQHTPIALATILVTDISSTFFTKAETTPTGTGEYTITDSKLTFSEADAGKMLFVTYDYSVEKATNFGLPKTPVRSAYRVMTSGEATGEDERLYNTLLTLDKAKVMGAINPAVQGGTPNAVTITFTILKPRGNNLAVDYKATQIE